MRLPQLQQRLRDPGAAPCHEGRVLRAWLQGRSLDTKRPRAVDYFPLALRDGLPGLFDELRGLARVHSEHPGEDGSSRLLVSLADGQTVESVLLPKDGLCVSTQVGWWLAERRGHLTASRMADATAFLKSGKEAAARYGYKLEIIA